MAGLNAKKIKNTGGGFKQKHMEAGTYPCRLVQIIDLGIQDQKAYDNKAKPPVQQLRLTYEFTDEFCYNEEGVEQLDKPRWLSETIPFLSMDADLATSTKRYKAVDPEDLYDGDFTKLIDIPVNVTVVNKEDKKGKKDNDGNTVVYNNIGALSTMRKRDADKCDALVNPAVLFLLSDPDLAVFNSLPDWLQGDIKKAHDYAGGPLEALLGGKEQPKQDADEPKDMQKDDVDGDKPW